MVRLLHNAELLNETMFRSQAHAREVLSLWQNDYNGERPRTSLDGAHAERVCKTVRVGPQPERTPVISEYPSGGEVICQEVRRASVAIVASSGNRFRLAFIAYNIASFCVSDIP